MSALERDEILHVLLVEDDAKLAVLTRTYLEGHGAVVTVADDGLKGLTEALRTRFDVVLLDIMLPGLNGMEICHQIRQRRDVPIIMITARGEEADRVMGLEIGADDYVPKPFSPRELLARMRAVVRRARGSVGPKQRLVRIGDLTLDPSAARAFLNDVELDLTAYEFAVLYALAEGAGRVQSREQLMERSRGNAEEAFDRSIDVHISRLRKKLGDDPHHPQRIKTVRGLGYLYMPAVDPTRGMPNRGSDG